MQENKDQVYLSCFDSGKQQQGYTLHPGTEETEATINSYLTELTKSQTIHVH